MTKSLFKCGFVVGLAVVSAASFAQSNVHGTTNNGNSRFTSVSGSISGASANGRTVKWGRSSLEFTGQSITANGNQPFKIGQLQWSNGSYRDVNGHLDMNLQVGLDFGSRGGGLTTLNLKYDESKSGQDMFTLPGSASFGSASIDGHMYNVLLAGYAHAGGNGKLNGLTWTNKEGGCDTICLFGKLEPCAVPEPASMAALGLGIAAIIRRRRSK